jgi:predicted porin
MKKATPLAFCAVAFAVSAVAHAQPSVTISGYLKMSLERLKIGDTAKSPSSETRVADNSSRIYFRVTEDLGSGLAAIGQIEFRPGIDSGALSAAGANYIGLQSKRMGALKVGRLDLHYFNEPSEIRSKAGSYKATPISLLAYAGGGGTAIASDSRTPNTVGYESPRWNGFAVTGAYSSSPAGAESDIGSGIRAGRAWNLVPSFAGEDFLVGYSYWSSKNDAGGDTVATGDQRGDRLFGWYRWGGFKIGAAWDKSKIKGATTGMGLSNRTVWSIPVQYSWGRNTVYAHFTRAGNDKAIAGQDGAKMWALAYNYDLSKRTAVGLTYTKIRNQAGAFYNLDNSAGGNGSPSGAVIAGEDPSLWAISIWHSF